MVHNEIFKITEDSDLGVSVEFYDIEIADEFDDFLTDHFELEFNLTFAEQSVTFYFGKKISGNELKSMCDSFLSK